VGQVVDALSGRPVAGAIVGMGGPPAPNGQPWPRVLTGSDGRFVFRDLRRGDYTITATKPGFAEGAYGRNRAGGPSVPLSLNEGERVGDVVVRLWKHAAISGTIVDESGERLVGVTVRAFRRTVIGGRRRFASSNSGTSDDRGVYRISGLLPGDYLVATVARQAVVPLSLFRNLPPGAPERNIPVDMGLLAPGDTAGLAVMTSGDAGILLGRGTPTPPPPVNGRLAVYPPTFHPSTNTGSASSVISLRPGEEHLDADLQLTPVPTVRVSGFIFGPQGPVGRTAVRLVPANTTEFFSEADLPSTTTDNGGAFVFPAVPSGHYSIRIAPRSFQSTAGAPPTLLWLDASLSAGTEDIDGLNLAALPGVRISGRLEFEGTTRVPVQLSNVSILIEPADVLGMIMTTRPSPTGELMSMPLPGGRYYVRIPNSPSGWMFKSATIDGRDVADTPFTLREEPTQVVITFTDRWSGIRGTVQGAAGRDGTATVIVFPTDQDTWGSAGMNPRRVRSTRTSRTGEYSFNLPPGDYYALAVPEEQSADWQDPEFLEAASRSAARVTIAEGERKIQDLRTRNVR
jgi:Carboxypeptidase regulatory-like domain